MLNIKKVNKMTEKEIEEMVNKVQKYLGVDIEELKAKILEKVMHIDVDYSKSILLGVYGKGDYYISKVQRGAIYERNGEQFVFEFSLIDPWDVYGFEGVFYDIDEGLYIDQSSWEKFTEDDLLEEALQFAIDGSCGKFEDEFRRFLIEFNNFLNSLE